MAKVLPVIVAKLISSNPCRVWNAKTPKKDFKPKKHEKVLPQQYLLEDVAKKAVTHKLSCHETFTPILAEIHKQLPVNGHQSRVIQRERQNNIHVQKDG